jgi:hypothetical protein
VQEPCAGALCRSFEDELRIRSISIAKAHFIGAIHLMAAHKHIAFHTRADKEPRAILCRPFLRVRDLCKRDKDRLVWIPGFTVRAGVTGQALPDGSVGKRSGRARRIVMSGTGVAVELGVAVGGVSAATARGSRSGDCCPMRYPSGPRITSSVRSRRAHNALRERKPGPGASSDGASNGETEGGSSIGALHPNRARMRRCGPPVETGTSSLYPLPHVPGLNSKSLPIILTLISRSGT